MLDGVLLLYARTFVWNQPPVSVIIRLLITASEKQAPRFLDKRSRGAFLKRPVRSIYQEKL